MNIKDIKVGMMVVPRKFKSTPSTGWVDMLDHMTGKACEVRFVENVYDRACVFEPSKANSWYFPASALDPVPAAKEPFRENIKRRSFKAVVGNSYIGDYSTAEDAAREAKAALLVVDENDLCVGNHAQVCEILQDFRAVRPIGGKWHIEAETHFNSDPIPEPVEEPAKPEIKIELIGISDLWFILDGGVRVEAPSISAAFAAVPGLREAMIKLVKEA